MGGGRSWNRKSQEARLCHRRDSAPARPVPGGGFGPAEGPGWGLTGEALEGDRGQRDPDPDRAGAGGGRSPGPPLRPSAMRRALHGTGVRRAGLREPGGGRGGPEVCFGAWRASRKRESGGPEVQVWGVKTARVPRKWDEGPGNQERGGSRAGDGPEMETREQLE